MSKVKSQKSSEKLKIEIEGLLLKIYYIQQHIVTLQGEIWKAEEDIKKIEANVKIKMSELQELASVELKKEAKILKKAGL